MNDVKNTEAASLRKLLSYVTRGTAAIASRLRGESRDVPESIDYMLAENLILASPDVNYDAARLTARITRTIDEKRTLFLQLSDVTGLPPAALWDGSEGNYAARAASPEVNILSGVEDMESLLSLLLQALTGISSCILEAKEFGKEDSEIARFVESSLAATLNEAVTFNPLFNLLMEAGRTGLSAMALLDSARTSVLGNPEITRIDTGACGNPGILVAGENLCDLASLLEQTKDTGIDVYTFAGNSSAHSYPHLKKYRNLSGNLGAGSSDQAAVFADFAGPVLVTSPVLYPVPEEVKSRLFTTGCAGVPGCTHITAGEDGKKDFSPLIAAAKESPALADEDKGFIIGGFARRQMDGLSGMISSHVRDGAIRKFAVIAGSDCGSDAGDYYTEFAENLPRGVIILTAGDIKFRFNSLSLGDILGIPRVLDAGEVRDVYSLITIARKQMEFFGLEDINDLPFTWSLSCVRDTDVMALFALLWLGVRKITVGPKMPANFSANIEAVLENTFGLTEAGSPEEDRKAMFADLEVKKKGFTGNTKITGDMLIGELVRTYPEVVPLLLTVGMHCVGCGSSAYESLTEACMVHGLNPDEVIEFINREMSGE